MANNTFKISDLEEIKSNEIDNKDSILITDYSGQKRFTKRLTIKRLMEVIAKNPQLIEQILAEDTLDQKMQEKIDNAVSAMTVQIIDGGDAIHEI